MARDGSDADVVRAAVRAATHLHGPEDLETMRARTGLAIALALDGRFPEAVREVSEVVRVRTAVFGPTDPATILAQRLLVSFLGRNGEWDRVAAVYPSIIEASMAVWGPRSDHTLGSRVNHANCLRRVGRDAEAEDELRGVLPVCVESLGDDHVVTEACRNALVR
jgi:eukaryotic-like serine/threonine-protein kinase